MSTLAQLLARKAELQRDRKSLADARDLQENTAEIAEVVAEIKRLRREVSP